MQFFIEQLHYLLLEENNKNISFFFQTQFNWQICESDYQVLNSETQMTQVAQARCDEQTSAKNHIYK